MQEFQPFVEQAVEDGVGHIWYAAASRGLTAYTLYTTRQYMARDPESLLRMTRAMHRTQQWIATHSAAELAASVAAFFPDLPYPLSGQAARIDAARARYITTAFCSGCNLGPTQTAPALQTFDRRQIAWIDQHHITEEKLDAAITTLINAYNGFALPKLWGAGHHASADGMKWDLYEQNLLAEYHIRNGGVWRGRVLSRLGHVHRPVQSFYPV